MGNFKEDIAKTKAFILDVDGVMTDGGIMPIEGGMDFIRKYNAKDGYAIAYAVRRGYKVCVITGGHGNLLRSRMERLGVTKLYLNCMDKIAAMQEFFAEYDVDPATTIYMGDDIPDLECMELVGIPVCPADACSEVVEASRYVSEFCGGRGAVRDIIEQTLRAQDEWAKDRTGVLGVASR
ncbi:MAG: HAD hydrolase family protein [Alistipes sp.]|nr:HAD hydrolase family protein [Alistipes sp.]MBP3564490.1 HAD hydrolase family protein [Alistipes sp.]